MKVVYRYITGLALLLALVVIVPARADAFTDTRQHWARLEIEHLQSREIISGYPDGSYGPETSISRQEFVVLLVRAMSKQKEAQVLEKGEASFSDTASTWARGYVELARELGIVEGDGQDKFSPTRAVSREEAVTMLVRCLQNEAAEDETVSFTDQSQISPWARLAVGFSEKNGLVHGFPDGSFRPNHNITRAEVAILLEALLTNQGKQHQIYGTITRIDLPLRQVTVNVAGNTENFELVSNLAVWNQALRQPETDIKLPAPAYLDLDSSGKLAFILLTNQKESKSVRLNYSKLPDAGAVGTGSGNMVSFAEEQSDEVAPAVSAAQANTSLQVTKEAMGATQFTSQTGATGKGQLVAIIDSGIDPGHPDLQTTTEGFGKMLDFIDLSNEGKVILKEIKAQNGFLELGDKKIDVSNLVSYKNLFKYGFLKLHFLPAGSGLETRIVPIIMIASTPDGGFDTAYIDTNGDDQVKDELPVREYALGQQVVIIKGEQGRQFDLVLSEISDRDNYIKLGFDASGHGTEVAGIVSAHGKVEGIAPDAQLLVIKITDRMGTTSLSQLESALTLAAERGAGVAVVSMGQYNMSSTERESLSRTAALLRKNKDMIICMAVGNTGPGVGTVADSTGIDGILTAGAYATPKMWKTDYGWTVPNSTLWYFSSTGPAPNAAAAPLLLAPGSAVSTYPLWEDFPYHKTEGTSIAAPHLAGAVALLLDAKMHRLYDNDSKGIYQALLVGARPLEGVQAVEQGYGAVDLMGAWQELSLKKTLTGDAEGRQYNLGDSLGQGLYIRGMTPASLSLHITNTGDTSTWFTINGLADWIKPQQDSIQVPAHSERAVDVEYSNLTQPGLYSGFLAADDFNTSGVEVNMLQTLVVPYDLGEVQKIEEKGQLLPGALRHYFFKVPDGASKVTFTLAIEPGEGRARIHVFSPNSMAETSSYTGIGPDGNSKPAVLAFSDPDSGIWEVVVYSSVSLNDYRLTESAYSLQASMDGSAVSSFSPADDRYFVSTVVPAVIPGKELNLTLFFWNQGSKLPVAGLVSIDDRLYEIENGMVTLPYIPQQDTINLNIAW